MRRMQIQFTEEQRHLLQQAAQERGISISAVVRGAIDAGLAAHVHHDPTLQVVGKYRGPADLSRRHDEYWAQDSEPE